MSSRPSTPRPAELDRDWKALTAFYAFPAEHGRHLQTTNPIESSFATVKLRTRVTKGAGSKAAALGMAYKLLRTAEEHWRSFNGYELVADVLAGQTFTDGTRVPDEHPTTLATHAPLLARRRRRAPPRAGRRAFVAACSRYVPELRLEDVRDGPAGVRAQALGRDGTLVDDFVFSETAGGLQTLPASTREIR